MKAKSVRVLLWTVAGVWIAGVCALAQQPAPPVGSVAPSEGTSSGPPTTPIARVGTQIITVAYFEASAIPSDHYIESMGKVTNKPAAEVDQEKRAKRRELLDTLIQDAVLRELALKSDAKLSDEELDKEVAQREEGAGGKATFESRLKMQGVTRDAYIERLRGNLAAQKYVDSLTKDVTVSDAEIAAEWEARKARGELTAQEGVEGVQLLLRPYGGSAKEVWDEAERQIRLAYDKIMGGTDFNTVSSDLANTAIPNMLPVALQPRTVRKKEGHPEVEAAAFATPAGQVTPPYKVSDGWAILQVKGVQTAKTLPLDDTTKEWLQADMMKKKRRAVVDKVLAAGRASVPIEILVPEYATQPASSADTAAAMGS